MQLRMNLKNVAALTLSLLLGSQAVWAGGAAQTLGAAKRQRQDKVRRPKLAPDLLAGLAQMEEDEGEAGRG
jgi:hypothetical protein